MSGFEVKKTGEITNTGSLLHSSTGSNDNGVTISFKNPKASVDEQTETQVKLLLKSLYPNLKWDELSNMQKQEYIAKFHDGSLQAEVENRKEEAKKIQETLKTIDPEKATDYLLDTYLSKKHANYNTLSDAEKAKLRRDKSIAIIEQIEAAQETEREELATQNGQTFKPKKGINELTSEQQDRRIANRNFTLEAMVWAYQNNQISNEEELQAILKDPKAIGRLQFEYAKSRVAKDDSILESDAPEHRALKISYNRGILNAQIAEANGMTVEEFVNSPNYTQMQFEYLDKKQNRTAAEEKSYQYLLKQRAELNGDLSGIRNHHNNCDVEASCMLEALRDEKNVDFENLTLDQIAKVKEHIIAELKECKTPEEIQAQISHIYSHVSNDIERDLYDGIFSHLLKQEDCTFDAELYYNAVKSGGITTHSSILHSHEMNAKNQVASARYVKEHKEEYTGTQAAGITTNIIPKYETEAQAPAMEHMTDTGYQEVYDVLPETYSKLDAEAAKQSYEYAMKSENITTEQKAIIAKDTIDTIQDPELKNFYQELANKYEVDYKSVPPKSERIAKQETIQTSENDAKIADTQYTAKEITEIFTTSSQSDKNFLKMLAQGVKETVDIILGKTPDNDVISEKAPQITSLNTAISELKGGTKLADVFRNSNNSTKKELVEIICTYGKTAISQLIDTFGGETVYNLAKTTNSKALIKKELQRIALSDATQRTALAQIEAKEKKDGLKLKA